MPRKKTEPLVAEAPNARINPEKVNVVSDSGQLARSYTRKVHGDDFLSLAKGYASKIKGRIEFPIIV